MPCVSMRSRRFSRGWITPLVVFGVAFLLRFLFVLHLRASPLSDVPMRDEFTLVEWARALASGDWVGSEVFFRAPLYPYLLGAQFVLFRGSLFAARIVQATLGALVPVALYLLGRRVFGWREAVAGAAVAVTYPFLIYFSNELLIVSVAVLLNVLLLLAVMRADGKSSVGRWFVAGVMLGCSAITRPNVLVFAPFLFLWMWRRARDTADSRLSASDASPAAGRASPLAIASRRFALVLLGAAVIISPVAVRNYAVGRDFVPIASQGGINFFIGNNAASDGASAMLPALGTGWEYDDAIRIAEREEGRSLKPSEVSGFWYRKGIEFLTENPGEAVRLYLRKLALFWDRYEIGSNKDIYHFGRMSPVFVTFSWLNFLLVAPLGLLGMAVTVRRRPGASLLTLFVLSYMGSVLIFFVNARFRLPTVPFLILLASAAAVWLFDALRSRNLKFLVAGAAFVCAVALFVHTDFYGTHVSQHAHTRYTIGLAYANQGQLEEALEEYRAAIDLWPDYASAHDAMGRALERLGRHEEALEAYGAATTSNRFLASAPMHAGVLLLRMGDMERALEQLREAVERDPSMSEAHFYLGSTLAGEGRLEEAEKSFRLSVAADSEFKEAWNGLGRVLEDTGRPREALRAYERALSIDPAFVDAHNNVAVLLATMGLYDEAIARFEAAIRIAPDDRRLPANLERVRQLKLARATRGG